jgi:dihydrofolate reductase
MNYKLVVAMSLNRGIGLNNKLPWNIKEDLKYFSKLTKGNGNNAIVMGKNTWNSIGSKPLPLRDNLILTSSKNNISGKNYCFFNNINNLLEYCKNKAYETVWIIGGSSIYQQFLNLNLIEECSITVIHKDYHCDTFFPILDDTMWFLNKTSNLETSLNYKVTINNFVKKEHYFSKGVTVVYTSKDGSQCKALIKDIHYDDKEVYYTIILDNMREINTEFKRLSKP